MLLWVGVAVAAVTGMADVQKACVKEMQTESDALVAAMKEVDGGWGLSAGEAEQALQVFESSFMFTATKAFKVFEEDDSTYVTTGDIGFMWLRDSCYELLPYLQAVSRRGLGHYPNTQQVIESAMHRMVSFINTDVYGSAFTFNHGPEAGPSKQECPPSPSCAWCNCTQCAPVCGDYTFQRNFELDSLIHVLLFHHQYYNATGLTTHLTTKGFREALNATIALLYTEMFHESKSPYVFSQPDGDKVKDGVGLVWSYARPSDDTASGGYSIPDNMMVVVVASKVAAMLRSVGGFEQQAANLTEIAATVESAIESLGVVDVTGKGKIYAYEVDGFGGHTVLDDANLPNLLWLPYLGYPDHLQLYNNTRDFTLSHKDLNYFTGSFATGLGSQHHSFGLRSHNPGPQCTKGCIWHLGLITEALTTSSRETKLTKLKQILATLAGQDLLHEGFSPSDPVKYNRDWFGWADAMYCTMLTTDWLGYQQ